jgi:hypothetical protein
MIVLASLLLFNAALWMRMQDMHAGIFPEKWRKKERRKRVEIYVAKLGFFLMRMMFVMSIMLLFFFRSA